MKQQLHVNARQILINERAGRILLSWEQMCGYSPRNVQNDKKFDTE